MNTAAYVCSLTLTILIMTGCAQTSTIPLWVSEATDYNSAVGCALIVNQDIVTARIIATNKAKSEYLGNKQVDVASNITMKTSQNTEGSVSNDFSQTIQLNTSGTIDHQFRIIKEEVIRFGKEDKLCVLMSY